MLVVRPTYLPICTITGHNEEMPIPKPRWGSGGVINWYILDTIYWTLLTGYCILVLYTGYYVLGIMNWVLCTGYYLTLPGAGYFGCQEGRGADSAPYPYFGRRMTDTHQNWYNYSQRHFQFDGTTPMSISIKLCPVEILKGDHLKLHFKIRYFRERIF